eukprot:SAG22_NODE_11971_length_461_cov_1.378453_1_plen_64_part_10
MPPTGHAPVFAVESNQIALRKCRIHLCPRVPLAEVAGRAGQAYPMLSERELTAVLAFMVLERQV